MFETSFNFTVFPQMSSLDIKEYYIFLFCLPLYFLQYVFFMLSFYRGRYYFSFLVPSLFFSFVCVCLYLLRSVDVLWTVCPCLHSYSEKEEWANMS